MNLAQAKAKFSEVIDRVEAGETIEITRRGKVAARIVPVEAVKEKINIEALRRLRATMTVDASPVGSVQRLREADLL